MLVAGGLWAGLKGYHRFVAHIIEQRQHEEELHNSIKRLCEEQNLLAKQVETIKKDISPNGKNTQRLGDIAARLEEKFDNLYDFMTRYAEKVDQLEQDVAKHIGYHEGADL